MGAIANYFRSVFRDYVTDGVPASGAREPMKSEIRAIGSVIEDEITSVAAEQVADAQEAADDAAISAAAAEAFINGKLFADTTAGLAGVASGEYFFVVSGGTLSLYLDNAGVAVAQNYSPVSQAALSTLLTNLNTWKHAGGRTSTPVTGISSGGTTWVYASPTPYTGLLRVKAFGGSAGGNLLVRRFTRSGSTFTQTGSDITVAVPATALTTVETGVTVNAGEYLGFYAPANGIAFTGTGTPEWGGVHSDTGNVTSFTDTTASTVGNLEVRFEVWPTDKLTELEERTAAVENEVYNTIAGNPGTLGVGDGGEIAANTFVFAEAIAEGGRLRVRARGGPTRTASIVVRRFTGAGGTYTQTGSDITVPVVAGQITEFDTGVEVEAGEYLGFWSPVAGLVAFTGGVAWSGGYLVGTGNSTGFTDSTATVSGSFELSFEVPASAADAASVFDGAVAVAFGDSITWRGDYPSRLATRIGLSMSNFGMGGTRLSSYTEGTTSGNLLVPLSMVNISACIASGDFSTLTAGAAAYVVANPSNDYTGEAAAIAGTDWDTVEYLIIFYGTNDFTAEVPLGTSADAVGTTFRGAVNVITDNLLTAYPELKIVWVGPLWRMVDGTDDADTVPNDDGDYLIDYVDALIEQVETNKIPVLDLYRHSGINAYNEATMLEDGTHPEPVGYQRIADKVASFITANF